MGEKNVSVVLIGWEGLGGKILLDETEEGGTCLVRCKVRWGLKVGKGRVNVRVARACVGTAVVGDGRMARRKTVRMKMAVRIG